MTPRLSIGWRIHPPDSVIARGGAAPAPITAWPELGLTYQLNDTPPPSPELVAATRDIFRSRGLLTY